MSSSWKAWAVVGTGVLAGAAAAVYLRRRWARQAARGRFFDGLRHATSTNIGLRTAMEDAHSSYVCRRRGLALFTVCDGHGGADAAHFVCQNIFPELQAQRRTHPDLADALAESVLALDKSFERQVAEGVLSPCGTTVVAAAVDEGRIVVAGTGDCRALLSDKGRARSLAVAHSPTSPVERSRIESAGAFIDCDGYLNGELAVSRSVGDGHLPGLKKPGGPLIADPDICLVELSPATEFLVLSSDGLTLRDETVISLARSSLRKNNCPQLAADALVEAELKSPFSKDNIAVTIICLGPNPPPELAAKRNRHSRLFSRPR